MLEARPGTAAVSSLKRLGPSSKASITRSVQRSPTRDIAPSSAELPGAWSDSSLTFPSSHSKSLRR